MWSGAAPGTMAGKRSRRIPLKHNDESRKEQLATEVLALVEHFHTPAPHDHGRRDTPRPLARLAVPVALEGLALLSFAHQLRARRRRSETPAARLRRGLGRAFVLRHL
jgi:hypothetical protein